MNIRASQGGHVGIGGDNAGRDVTKTVTTHNDGGIESLLLVKMTAIELRLSTIERHNQRQGIEDMISKRFLTIGAALSFILLSFGFSIVTQPQPTVASVSVNTFDAVNQAGTPSLTAPTINVIAEWCLGAALTIEEHEDMVRRANNGEYVRAEAKCTDDKVEFSDWLADIGAKDAPILQFVVNDGETPSLVNNPILGVGFDCAQHNYGCSVLYYHANTLDLNQDFMLSSMPNGWDNRVSSHQRWTHHTVKLFEHSGLGGANVTCGSCSSLGIMNNHVSSIWFIN